MHKLLFLLTFLALTSPAMAQHAGHNHHHQNSAPVGVTGDHLMEQGDIMATYAYSTMVMDGNQDGTNDLTTADVLGAGFMIAPTKMNMEMHMLGVMAGVTEDTTIMAMIPYIRKSMDHITGGGAVFETDIRGFGDLALSATHDLWQSKHKQLLLNAKLSLPTGATDEHDQTPSGYAKLPYPMQLGSGTYDPTIGLTFTNTINELVDYGAQISATPRLGKNNEGYRLGNEYNAQSWVSYSFYKPFSTSLRLDARRWGNIKGADSDLTPAMVPTARTDLRGGERVDVLWGIQANLAELGGSEDDTIGFEVGAPLYQRLDGPQLQTDFRVLARARFTF